MKKEKSLLILESPYIGEGYRELNALVSQCSIEIIEVDTLNDQGFFSISQILQDQVETVSHTNSKEILKTVIERPERALLEACYGLNTKTPEGTILIAEFSLTGAALSLINHALCENEIQIVDINYGQVRGAKRFVILSGGVQVMIQLNEQWAQKKVFTRVTRVDLCTPFKDYFSKHTDLV